MGKYSYNNLVSYANDRFVSYENTNCFFCNEDLTADVRLVRSAVCHGFMFAGELTEFFQKDTNGCADFRYMCNWLRNKTDPRTAKYIDWLVKDSKVAHIFLANSFQEAVEEHQGMLILDMKTPSKELKLATIMSRLPHDSYHSSGLRVWEMLTDAGINPWSAYFFIMFCYSDPQTYRISLFRDIDNFPITSNLPEVDSFAYTIDPTTPLPFDNTESPNFLEEFEYVGITKDLAFSKGYMPRLSTDHFEGMEGGNNGISYSKEKVVDIVSSFINKYVNKEGV